MKKTINLWQEVANLDFSKPSNVLFALTFLRETYPSVDKIPEELRNNNTLMNLAVKHGLVPLYDASPAIQDNEYLVLAACKHDIFSLRHASKRVKNNPEAMTTFLINLKGDFKYVGEELKKNKDIVSKAIKINYNALQYADDTIKNDLDFANDVLMSYPCPF